MFCYPPTTVLYTSNQAKDAAHEKESCGLLIVGIGCGGC